MHINKGDAIHYSAILIRVRGTHKRLHVNEYGYAIEAEHNNIVQVDNGIRIQLVHTDDILQNFGANVLFKRKNDTADDA